MNLGSALSALLSGNFNYEEQWSILLTRLNYSFKNRELLVQALIHPSFLNECKEINCSNQSLEFLGDALFNAVISKELYLQGGDEGTLSKGKNQLVNEEHLYQLATLINVENALVVGKGIKHKSRSMIADAMEAIVGALFLDSSFVELERVLQHLMNRYAQEFKQSFFTVKVDFKTALQELVVKKFNCYPVYKFEQVGDLFRVQLWIDNKMMKQDMGRSKKEAASLVAEKLYGELLC